MDSVRKKLRSGNIFALCWTRTTDQDVLQVAVISLNKILLSHGWHVFLGRWSSPEPLAMFKMEVVTLMWGYSSLYRLSDVAEPRMHN